MEDFSKRIKRLRQEAGYKDASSFAEKAGLKYTTYKNYELPENPKEPKLSNLVKMADCLNITLDELTDHTGNDLLLFIKSLGFIITEVTPEWIEGCNKHSIETGSKPPYDKSKKYVDIAYKNPHNIITEMELSALLSCLEEGKRKGIKEAFSKLITDEIRKNILDLNNAIATKEETLIIDMYQRNLEHLNRIEKDIAGEPIPDIKKGKPTGKRPEKPKA